MLKTYCTKSTPAYLQSQSPMLHIHNVFANLVIYLFFNLWMFNFLAFHFYINNFACWFWKKTITQPKVKTLRGHLWRFIPFGYQRWRVSREDSVIHLGVNLQVPGYFTLQNSFLSWSGNIYGKINRSSKCLLISPVETYIVFLLFKSLEPHFLPLRTNSNFSGAFSMVTSLCLQIDFIQL